jgi:hypothetical protein
MSFNEPMQNKHTSANATRTVLLSRWAAFGLISLAGFGWSGCATQSTARFSPAAVAAMSPAAEIVAPFEAMRLGKKYVADHPGTEFLVGSGDSMLPLYKDHTVVVTQQVAVADLKPGMTAVYFGDSGRPVAHVLVQKTSDGWVAMGVGNARADTTLVTKDNLLGVVVRAFEPTSSPMLALLNEAASKSSVASMP